MNIFAGNFSIEKDVEVPEIDYDIVKISQRNFFIMGGSEEIETSKHVLEFIESIFGKILAYDISIDTEEELEILSSEYEDGCYECVSFEGPHVSIEDILERFADSAEVACIREAGESKRYANKIIKADFLY